MELEIPPSTSASQLQTYAMCPRKYAFSYVYGVEPEYRSKALVLGSAIHSAVGWWFEERIAGRSPAVAAAEEVFTADFLAVSAGALVRWKETTPDAVEEDGRKLLRLYLAEKGELPVRQVEQPFEAALEDPKTGECVGRSIKGYLDLTLDDHSVVELKTSARGWNDFDLVRHLQVGAYAFAWNTLHGGPSQLEVQVIIKLKREPRIETYRIERGEDATRWWLHAAWAIERAIEARNFPPSPSPLCRECEYESACANWIGEAPRPQPARRLPMLSSEHAADF